MNPNDVQNLIFSIRDQTNKLKKTVQENLKVTKSYTEKPLSSKFSIPYDPSLEDIRDTLENDESFAYTLDQGSRKYPPLELIPSTFKNRSEPEPLFGQERYAVMSELTPTNDRFHFDEYSFHTPAAFNDKEAAFGIKTAEFEGLMNNETEPDYSQNYKKNSKRILNKSPNKVSQASLIKENEEMRNMKQTIEGLSQDNQVLSQNIEDFKKGMQILVEKHKELQRQLDVEKKKSERAVILEKQLREERAKNKTLNERNFILKEKAVKLVEFLHHLSKEEQKDIEEEEKLYAQIAEENRQLREVLGISRVSDPKFIEMDQYMRDKENEFEESKEAYVNNENDEELNADDLRLTPAVLEKFRKERQTMFSLQRTFSAYSDKSVQGGNSATKTVINSYASTENIIESASRTVSSNHSLDQIRYMNTNETNASDK